MVLDIPPREGTFVGVCPRCGHLVHRYHPNPSAYSLSLALGALIFLLTSNFLPFLSINFSGLGNSMAVLDYTEILGNYHLAVMSVLIFVFMQFLPVVAILCIIVCDLCYLLKLKFKAVKFLLKVYHYAREWSMVDVFVLGVLVSLIKLINLVDVTYEDGFWTYMAFAVFFILAVRNFYEPVMWSFFEKSTPLTRTIRSGRSAARQNFCGCEICGQIIDREKRFHCPRCGKVAEDKSEKCVQRCAAFLIAAVAVYIPANIYPMMITVYLGSGEASTILEGVVALWKMKSYFVSGVIFLASVCIPILKIMALVYLCVVLKNFKRARRSRYLSVLFRVVEFIGKWSMIDVFVVAIMVSIVRMGNLMVIEPGSAMVSFGAVVILTMLAARQFDSKLLWINKINRGENNE